MVDFSTHPYSLCLEDERCELWMKLFGFDSIVVSRFETVGELLAILLNRSYYPDLISLQQFHQLGTKTESPEGLPWYKVIDSWDHDRVEAIIRKIYESEDAAVNALKPSQRFRILLAFQKDFFTCEYVEQPYSYPQPILDAARAGATSFAEHDGEENAMYKAGCRIAESQGVYLPKQEQYWFATSQDMIMWLLRYVMESDRYIKKCEHCGRYFVPRRNTKKYCSDPCANTQRNQDSFCGVQEAKQLYKRIVSNLSAKGKRLKKLQLPYIRRDEPDVWIKPQEVLKEFYSENAGYMNALREAFEALPRVGTPTEDQTKKFETAKDIYVKWLQEQYDYATSLKLERDPY